MNLERVVNDVADALKTIDTAGVPFKDLHAGAGPYGEPQLVKLIAEVVPLSWSQRLRVALIGSRVVQRFGDLCG